MADETTSEPDLQPAETETEKEVDSEAEPGVDYDVTCQISNPGETCDDLTMKMHSYADEKGLYLVKLELRDKWL